MIQQLNETRPKYHLVRRLDCCLSVVLSDQRAFLLENVPCNVPDCAGVGRMFRIHWDQTDLGAIQKAVMATFFDIYEDVSRLPSLILYKAS